MPLEGCGSFPVCARKFLGHWKLFVDLRTPFVEFSVIRVTANQPCISFDCVVPKPVLGKKRGASIRCDCLTCQFGADLGTLRIANDNEPGRSRSATEE